MSDNEDLLGDDLGDQSLADYNLGNEEEEQLLADDYESGSSQNVPPSLGPNYANGVEMVPREYSGHSIDYGGQIPYQAMPEAECVVPNITVEIPNTPLPDHSAFPYEQPPVYGPEHAVVPPPIPAAVPVESSQIVPSEIPPAPVTNAGGMRGRPQRLPRHRDIPDSLDKVVVPYGAGGRGWRPQRYSHPYRRTNVHRGNFLHRATFPPPHIRPTLPPPSQIRPDIRPEIRQEMRPEVRPEMRPEIRPEMRPDIRPEMRPEIRPEMRPDIRPEMRPEARPEMRPDIRPEMRPDIHMEPPVIRMEPPVAPPNLPMRPEQSPERPMLQEVPFRSVENSPGFGPNFQRFPNPRPNFDEPRPFGPNIRPNFEPRPMFHMQQPFNRPFGPVREIAPNSSSHMPQVTIRQPLPIDKFPKVPGREPEVRMLPLQLPPNLPPGGLAGKKVLINPHFKGNFQPPVEGVATYIPTRIHKSPPLSPTLESKFGPIKDIDDAAERFIAEQRNALARAASRKFARRSPQRYIENTTIEIENELAAPSGVVRRRSEDELLRRQEEFISANRAGLRRRMRTPSPPEVVREPRDVRDTREPRDVRDTRDIRDVRDNRDIRDVRDIRDTRDIRDNRDIRDIRDVRDTREPRDIREARDSREPRRRSPSGGRSPGRRRSPSPRDEESEYRRRMREQESLRERVLRAKEARRRKAANANTNANAANVNANANANDNGNNANRPTYDKVDRQDFKELPKIEEPKLDLPDKPTSTEPDNKPDTTRVSPEKIEKVEKVIRERSPIRHENSEVNSTCEPLTPPRRPSPERALTPPLPPRAPRAAPANPPATTTAADSDDDLDLILGDIDGILSDDDDTGRFKEKSSKAPAEPPRQADLRGRLPPRRTTSPPRRATSPRDSAADKRHRQKIVFDTYKAEKSSGVRDAASGSTPPDYTEREYKTAKSKQKADSNTTKSRQRITFNRKETEQKEKDEDKKPQSFPNRRVILQTKFSQQIKEKSVFSRIDAKSDPSKPNPGIFSRAVRTAIGSEKTRIVIKKQEEPEIEYGTDSDLDEDKLLEDDCGMMATVANLPHGMTDTRLKTLAGNDVQSLVLDKEACSAKITFKTTTAAEQFRRKFDNKMVSKSRLTVKLR